MVNFFTLLIIFGIAAADEVCYPPYGCFTSQFPFNQAFVQLPELPSEVGTTFLYFTRKNPIHPLFLNPTAPNSPSANNFDPNKKTVMLVHGYIESRKQWYVQMFIDELLKHDDMNVIFTDWSYGAGFPYHQAYGNARLVGAQLSRMVEVLHNDTGVSLHNIHLIGFSIGAHIVGYAGRNLKRRGMIIGRITGLDPAAPYYESEHIDVRLDPTDADFVDVVHTDGKTILINGFGTIQEMGHIDFYPNGGFHQLGCGKLDIGVVQYLACSHYRAVRYFMESINSQCPYYGVPCASYKSYTKGNCVFCSNSTCPRMGYHAMKPEQKQDGVKFYLKTHTEFPFCGYHYIFGFYTDKRLFGDLSSSVVTVKIIGSKNNETIDLPRHTYDSGSIEHLNVLLKKDLGVVQSVNLRHDRIIDIWYLRGMTVRPIWSNTEYTACYNKWLNSYDSGVVFQQASISSCPTK
ncbi:inactive pancreatic lipase-related protein 1-like [Hydractinia symbiolongicarpus]|uniref:inactive pancreatic lipase-related protein 1-like n=1 Tax=Hydractinia symbiolongicarpus TaxID=13093 RepID=UPI00254B87F7|nr:inactive pancreatic lipase-related protein 1-like [Hydractinia symbiolongicarpus]